MDQDVRNELDGISAETFALQTLFVVLMNRLKRHDPTFPQVFDEAANIIENLALGRASKLRHLPHAIRVIEELRTGVTSQSKPQHGI